MARKASAKADDVKKCLCRLRRQFTNDEWKERVQQAEQLKKQAELKEDSRKAAQATARAEIKELQTRFNDHMNDLGRGYEEIDVPATVEYNAKKGTKSFFYWAPDKPATHKTFIRDDAMTPEDYELLPGVATNEPEQPPGGSGELNTVGQAMQAAGEEKEEAETV